MNVSMPNKKLSIIAKTDKYRELVVVGTVFAVIIIVALALLPTFRGSVNLRNVLMQCTALGLVCLGQYFVILSGSLDFSVGSTVSLVTILMSGLINGKTEMVAPITIMVLFVGLLIGLINGIGVTKLRINPIIVTLGMMSIVQGVAFLYTLTAIGSVPTGFTVLSTAAVGPIPASFIFLLVTTVAAYIILERTAFGGYIHATGGSENVARLAGINSDRIKITAHLICGFMAALAGIYLVSRMGVGSPTLGTSFTFDSLTVVLLSGAALFSGAGNIAGLLPAVLILAVMNNVMNLADLDVNTQTTIKGVILLLVVAIYARKQK